MRCYSTRRHGQPGLVWAQPSRQPPAEQSRRTRRPWIIAGAAAAGIPVGPGLAWAIAGHPGALLLLIIAAVLGGATSTLNAAVAMYQARQETIRTEIKHRSPDIIAAALARLLDDAHATTQDLPAAKATLEAEQVRASARQLLTDPTAPLTALLLATRRDAPPPDADCPQPPVHQLTGLDHQ